MTIFHLLHVNKAVKEREAGGERQRERERDTKALEPGVPFHLKG